MAIYVIGDIHNSLKKRDFIHDCASRINIQGGGSFMIS